ncbi:hypothetical protein GGI12_000138 [Dipsacomyces acuminosporus]|nr:hypothetical protein GGI12_000138 [Dipsacomyces acuminosporus]
MDKSIKRRSQVPVRKDDIRVLPNRNNEPAIKRTFSPAQSVGSGDESDLCYQRLQAWLHMVENYQEFFKSMVAAELDLATVYARVGDILQVPLYEHILLMPADGSNGEGVQSVTRRLKAYQQRMVEGHSAIGNELKASILGGLADIRDEIQGMANSYAASLRSVYAELQACKKNVKKRAQLLQVAIDAADGISSFTKEVVKDPFIISLEVEALLRKRAEIESKLQGLVSTQLSRIKECEPKLVERITSTVGRYMSLLNDSHRQLRHSTKKDARAIERVDGGAEWAHFSTMFHGKLGESQSSTVQPTADEMSYPGKNSEWVRVLRQGVVALKEHGPLFRSTWQSKYGVLTSRGYFHVFRSQGDVAKGAPETSVFLPQARIAMVRAGTLQISTGNKFNRCRITIQDGASSLDNWRLLMESVCFRNAGIPDADIGCGLATPPDSGSSSDESPTRCLGRSRDQPASANLAAHEKRRRSAATIQSPPRQPRSLHATPVSRARPFSVNLSMLTSNSRHMSAINQQMLTTPTHNIYMHPLEGTPQAAADTPVGSLPFVPATHLSPIMNVSELSFEVYSPMFSDAHYEGSSPRAVLQSSPNMVSYKDSSDGTFEQGNEQVGTMNSTGSSSSGAPHQPASLFERNLSQDTESVPIASLPKIQSKKALKLADDPCRDDADTDSCGPATANNIWSTRQMRFGPTALSGCSGASPESGHAGGGSALKQQSSFVGDHRHQYSSSTGYVPRGYSYADADIWHSDVLSIPDPAMRASGEPRQRPRSMIYQLSSCHSDAILDPDNPYLGDLLTKGSGTRSARVASRASTSSTGQQTPLWRNSAKLSNSLLAQPSQVHQRVSSHAGTVVSSSPPLPSSRLSVGPCHSTPAQSRDLIPECADECDIPAPDH